MDIEMRNAIRAVSESMQSRAVDLSKVSRERLRAFVEERIGTLLALEKADDTMLRTVQTAGGLLAVDGSYNRMGGAAPHFIEIYKGFGFCTTNQNQPVTVTSVQTPLTSARQETDFSFGDRSKESEMNLAKVELETAMQLVKAKPGYALVMDGSLIRFAILCPELWEELRILCEEKKLPLVGIIEDIKTDGVGKELQQSGLCKFAHFDREILRGKLEIGEIIEVAETFPGKSERGLSAVLARFSAQPHVIGIDMAGFNPPVFREIARVLYAITPAHGRGIPGILDIVDEKARITDLQMKEMLGAYVAPAILETYFFSMRSKRSR